MHWFVKRFVKIGLFLIVALLPAIVMANRVVMKAHGNTFPTYPKIDYGTGEEAEIVRYGEYLAKMGDCIACHTNSNENGAPYAGGLPFDTPFGIFYSPNITMDETTGIGKWTEQEYMRAVREGIRPDGSNCFPVFPYVYFNKATDEDLHAIYAYLKKVPVVKQRNRPNKVSWPFSWRFLQGGWKYLFFDYHKGPFIPDPNRSEDWNEGAYIVQSLGHCEMCHSPLNIFGASERNKFLGGAFVDGYYAPNITSATLGDKSVAEIVSVFKENKLLDNAGMVQGPMEEVNHDSLRYLTDEDLADIATYLKTVPAVKARPVKVAAGSGAAQGKAVYDSTCAVCHNSGAAGAPKRGDAAEWKPRIAMGIDTLVKNAIHGINSMPPKGTCMTCTDQQIKDAVLYIIEDSKGGAATADAKPAMRTAPPAVDRSLALGKKIYTQSCAMCHAEGKYGAPITGDKLAWQIRINKGVDQLFINAIRGYNAMPAKGACLECSNADIEAAVKYMVQESSSGGNYTLW